MAFIRNPAQPIPQQYDRTDPLGRNLLFWAPLTEQAGTIVNSLATANVRGTFTGGATWCAGGPTGSCVNLPASGTINFSTPNSFRIIGPITISIWANFANYSNYNGLLTKSNGGFPAPIDWYTIKDDGHSRFFLGDNGTNYVFTQANTVPQLGVWNHLVVTVNNTGRIAGVSPVGYHYLNGVFDGTDGTTNLLLGNRADGVTQANAKYADVRVYGRMFTDSEVKLLYLDGLRPMLARRRIVPGTVAAAAPPYRARVVRWG
jgi:hypothetical protein